MLGSVVQVTWWFSELTCVTPQKVSFLFLNPGYGLVPRSEENIIRIRFFEGMAKMVIYSDWNFAEFSDGCPEKKLRNIWFVSFCLEVEKDFSLEELMIFNCLDVRIHSRFHPHIQPIFYAYTYFKRTNGYIHFVYLHDCKSIFLYACIKHLDNRGMSVPYYSVGKLYKFQRRRSAAVFARSPPFLRPKKQISPVL